MSDKERAYEWGRKAGTLRAKKNELQYGEQQINELKVSLKQCEKSCKEMYDWVQECEKNLREAIQDKEKTMRNIEKGKYCHLNSEQRSTLIRLADEDIRDRRNDLEKSNEFYQEALKDCAEVKEDLEYNLDLYNELLNEIKEGEIELFGKSKISSSYDSSGNTRSKLSLLWVIIIIMLLVRACS